MDSSDEEIFGTPEESLHHQKARAAATTRPRFVPDISGSDFQVSFRLLALFFRLISMFSFERIEICFGLRAFLGK